MLIRSFIALYPDPVAREVMGRFVACLRLKERAVRWEQTEKIHVTMKFLGDVDAAMLKTIADGLQKEVAGEFAGDIEGVIDRTGAFPNMRRPRVVWVGFSDPPERMQALQRLVEKICVDAGAERENKPFTPHFTVGRPRQDGNTEGLENALQACSFQPSPVRFTRLSIMESTLTPQGAIHKERTHISLTPGE
ncbi:MAG: RNA 2',3'-cyclic phosphodiesterase [Bacteroidota bacterium]|jgi:2'-5' RNA ligase